MRLNPLLLLPVLLACCPALLADDVPNPDDLDALTEFFARDPLYTSASLSPDCEALVYRFVDEKQNAGLRFMEFPTGKNYQMYSRKDYDVGAFGWVDSRTAFYFLAFDGYNIEANTISLDKFRPRTIPIDGFGRMDVTRRSPRLRLGLNLQDSLPNLKSKLLVSYAHKGYRDLMMLDVDSGEKKIVAENDGTIAGWYCDDEGRPWVVGRRDEETKRYGRYYRFNQETGDSEELESLSLTRTGFLSISRDGKRALVVSDMESELRGICQFDLETGQPISPVMRDAEFDMNSVWPIYVPHMEMVVGAHVQLDKPKTFWFNPTLSRLQEIVDASMPPNRRNEIIGFHPNGTTFFINSYSDTVPREIVKVDLKEKKMDVVLRSRPWINPEQMSPMEMVRMPAPDGETIYGYLTLPREHEGPVPLIIDLIGGPGGRNYWGFDSEAQYYASQGIAFLSLNYRGCNGHGNTYLGGEMNLRWAIEHIGDDAAAAAQWAIAEGIADPKSVGVMGGSFGGFGALSAATRHPGVFKAVATFAGFFEIDELIRADKRDKPEWLESFYAGLLEDKEFQREMSPLEHVSRIDAPVLLVHGTEDRRVESRQAKRMGDALKDAGKDVEVKVLRDQGHNYGELRERLRTVKLFGEFMRKHLLSDALLEDAAVTRAN